MRLSYLFRSVGLVALAAVLAAGTLSAAPLADGDDPIAAVTTADGTISWMPLRTYDRLFLVIRTPDDREISREYLPGETPMVSALSNDLGLLPDGDYTYRVVLVESGTEVNEGEVTPVIVQEGPFVVTGYTISQPEGVMPQVFTQDVIVQGSICAGLDCTSTESFGFATIRLKENNTRIEFVDTSNSASFPSNDWGIVANGSDNGGANYLAFQDGGTSGNGLSGPLSFRVDAGAGENALRVNSTGIGIGTVGAPVLDVHAESGNTPGLRLQQNGSQGWSPQTWDVAGNETNFFVRDVTNGSRLPFRIRPGAPENSFYIQGTGNVGLGTANPTSRLHIPVGDANIGGGLYLGQFLGITGDLAALAAVIKVKDTVTNQLLLKLLPDGNMTIGGTLTEGSSIHIKSDFEAVDNQDILDRLVSVPLWTWRYTADRSGARHLGPTSQDFMAAFGLGEDDEHISAVDRDGVNMAAIQALYTLVQEKDQQIDALTEQNEALEARLARLEALLLQGSSD